MSAKIFEQIEKIEKIETKKESLLQQATRVKEKDIVVTTDAEMKSDLDKPVDNEKEVEMNVDRQIDHFQSHFH